MKSNQRGRIRFGLILAIVIFAAFVMSNLRLVKITMYNLTAPVWKFDEKTIDSTWADRENLPDIQYGEKSENQKLTLYLPEGSGYPLVILLYGGGACMNNNTSR